MVLHGQCGLSSLLQLKCVFSRSRSLIPHGNLGSTLLSQRPSWSPFRERKLRAKKAAQPCFAFSVAETLSGFVTPVQLSVTAFNADPSNVCSCDQKPGLPKPNKE